MKVSLPQVVAVLVLLAAPLYQAHAATPIAHYPFDTVTGGTTTPDLSGANNTGTLQPPNGPPTLVAGVVGTGALQFDGVDDTVSTATQFSNPPLFTLALWFKTSTSTGGKLIGFGNTQVDISGGYDRHIYMANDGHVFFGVYPGEVKTISTTSVLNDDQWHHIAASLSPAGLKLYVDGVLQASDPAVVTAQGGLDGWWKIGGDNIDNWTGAPTSRFFKGTMDEVRIYHDALTDAEILTLASRTPAVTLTAAPSPSFFNQPVVFSGTVASPLGTPTGGVELFEGQTSLGTATLNNGAYSFTISNLALGTHPLTVHYNGDNAFLAADSAVVNHTVNAPQATTTTLTAAPNGTQVFGAPVVLTAVVAPGTPTGTVTFLVDGNPTIVTLANGQASLTLSTLAVGAHAFSATYNNTIGFVTSASGTVNYTVTQASSTTVLVSSQNPVALGQSVTFTATVAGVAPSTAQAAGTVVFTIAGQPQAPVTLNAGVATLAITLAAGNHVVSAAYSGSTNVSASSSTPPLTQAVVVPPIADSQIVFVAINGSKSFTLTGSDPANSLPLTFNVLTQPANGTLSGTAPNLTFTPTAGFSGTVTFTFNVNNTRVNSLPATVTLNVLPPPSFNSSITFQPNPVFAGQMVTGFSPVTGVSTTWNWGDGSPLSVSASASHIFTQTGVYTVAVTVTDPLSGLSTVETALVFVSASLEGTGTGTGGGATPPGTIGILVGGTGATAAQGGKGKISCNYVRRDKTTYSGQLGSLAIPTTVTQASLTNVPSTLTIGTGANASVFRFDLNAKGKGKATGLPAIEFSVKKKRVSFKAQRIDLTTLTETLGGPQEFTKAKQPKTLMVPVTLQLGTQYFVAMTFQLKYQQINNGGKGALAP